MKVLFMGGNQLGAITLKNLIQNNINIIGVIVIKTDDTWYSGVDEIANEYKIKLYEETNINDPNFIEQIRKLNPDLIVCVNFAQILKKDIINLPRKGCINTHASLLPMYRGRAPLNWAIINGEKEVGVTVHFIEEGIDTGDIIIQERVDVKDTDYIEDVLNNVKMIYPDIVLKAIRLIEKGIVVSVNQDDSKGCYFGKRTKEDGEININDNPKKIMNLIKAVSRPYPGAFIIGEDYHIIIWKAKLSYENPEKYGLRFNGDLIQEKNYVVIKLKECLLITDDFYLFNK